MGVVSEDFRWAHAMASFKEDSDALMDSLSSLPAHGQVQVDRVRSRANSTAAKLIQFSSSRPCFDIQVYTNAGVSLSELFLLKKAFCRHGMHKMCEKFTATCHPPGFWANPAL